MQFMHPNLNHDTIAQILFDISIMPNASHLVSVSSSQPTVAKPMVRLVAIIYDGMLILAMLFLVGSILAVLGTVLFLEIGTSSQEAQTLPNWYKNVIMTPSFVLTLVGFYGIFWRKSGQTLGMQTWRLKTVNDQGGLLTWRQSFVRIISACLLPALCALLGALLHGSKFAILVATVLGFLFNFLFCLFNRQGLAVHDMLSNTITLKVPKIAHQTLWQTIKHRKNRL